VLTDKLALRNTIKSRLGAMTLAQRAEGSARAVAALRQAAPVARALAAREGQPPAILLYVPMPFEVDIAPLAHDLLAAGAIVCVPSVDWPGLAMRAIRIQRWPEDLVLEARGVMVPRAGWDGPRIEPEALDCVLVPGVAFDTRGGRLGRGGGFYDRYLTRVDLSRRLGVCFHCQIAEHVPMQPHDARVGTVISG
jgi:5-formyltetrahydrofolate cyclo-ligase